MPNWLMLLLPLIGQMLQAITPALRDLLRSFAVDFYNKAKATDNPVDDFLALLLLGVLNIPIPPQ